MPRLECRSCVDRLTKEGKTKQQIKTSVEYTLGGEECDSCYIEGVYKETNHKPKNNIPNISQVYE